MFKKLFLIFVLSCNAASAQSIKYGQVGVPLITDLPTYVAYDKGMFAKRGLDIEEAIQFNGSAISFVALATGEIKFQSGGLFLALVDLYNTEAFLIGRNVANSASFLYANSSISSVDQLRGKKVTAGGESDITRMQAEVIFNAHGITKDIDWFWSPDSVKRLMVMGTNHIQAAILIPPFTYAAEKQGFKLLAKVSDYKVLTHKALVFNKNWANTNPDKVQKITDSVSEAIEWIYDVRNRDEAAGILAKASRMSQEDALRSVDFALSERLYPDAAIPKDTLDYFLSVARSWNIIKPRQDLPLEKILVSGARVTQ
jgi:ABC-type nitrate/sulfonate/bicarbonate transport system substrate-binding protein